jgi:hypothetical protein
MFAQCKEKVIGETTIGGEHAAIGFSDGWMASVFLTCGTSRLIV